MSPYNVFLVKISYFFVQAFVLEARETKKFDNVYQRISEETQTIMIFEKWGSSSAGDAVKHF